MKKLPFALSAVGIFLCALDIQAQETHDSFELEGGIISTQNMEIHGFNQGDATSDFKKSTADVRMEYWRREANDWDYGVVLQPLTVNYSGRLSNTLTYHGVDYQKGDQASLHYEFPTLRLTANYPMYQSQDSKDYIRLGGSTIVRYASVKLATNSHSFGDTNLLALPVFNVEANKSLGNSYSLFTRSDFLPSVNGNTFLDGLFDIFVGVRTQLGSGDTVDVGVRSCFGGYDPKEKDNYANRIFFNAVVVRYSWK